MKRAEAFTSEILRTSTRGLAGMAAALFFERDEGAHDRYGDDGFESWRQAIGARISALASAMDVGDVGIYADDVRWFRSVSQSRGIEESDLASALACLGETIAAHMPDGTAQSVTPYLEAGVAALAEGADVPPEFRPGSDAADLFELALLGDLGGARHLLADGIRSGRMTIETAIVDVVLPAAREAGRRWHLGQMGVAVEHVVTATLRSALHSVTAVLERPAPNGKAAFVCSVPGDAHDTALVAFALLLEQDGWRVALAGADVPTEEIEASAEGYECDLIALSATLNSQRHSLSSFLARRESDIPVLVGGAALRGEDDAKKLGADGYASDLERAVDRARELVGLPPRRR